MSNDTPITKFLSNLERRKTIFSSSTTSPDGENRNIKKLFDFNDDTFLGDESLLKISPSRSKTPFSQAAKRKRYSNVYDDPSDFENDYYKQKADELEKILTTTQAEMIDLRTKITKIEKIGLDAKKSFKEQIIKYEMENEELIMKNKRLVEKAEAFDKQLEKVAVKEKELNEKLQTQHENYFAKAGNLEAKVIDLQRENIDILQQLDEANHKSSESVRKLTTDLTEVERGAEKWIMDTMHLREQLVHAQSQLKEKGKELEESQEAVKTLTEFKAQVEEKLITDIALEEKLKRFENLYIKETYQNQNLVKEIKKLNEDNGYLKNRIRSEMLLEEKINSYENQIKKQREELKEKINLEIEVNMFKKQVTDWKIVAKKVEDSCETPLMLESFLRQLQNMLLEIKHENSNLKLSLENTKRTIKGLKDEITVKTNQRNDFAKEKEKISGNFKIATKRLFIMTKNRDSLQSIVASYEQEFSGQITKNPMKDRNTQLENLIKEYEDLLNDKENAKSCDTCKNVNTALDNFKAHLDNTLNDSGKESSINQTLSSSDTSGEIRVVSYAFNPSLTSIQQRFKDLLLENEALKEKIKNLENTTSTLVSFSKENQGSSSGSGNGEKGENNSETAEKLKKLEADYKDLEIKHNILTESYNYETSFLQLVCYKLFGYHVVLLREAQPQRQIKLQSVYSTGTEDFFIFQEADNGELMLLDTPILTQFKTEIDRFLMQDASIPAFISAVTICFVQGQMEGESESGTGDGGQVALDVSVEDQAQGQSGQREVEVNVGDSEEEDEYAEEDEEEDDGYQQEFAEIEEEEVDDEEEEEEDEDDDNDEEQQPQIKIDPYSRHRMVQRQQSDDDDDSDIVELSD